MRQRHRSRKEQRAIAITFRERRTHRVGHASGDFRIHGQSIGHDVDAFDLLDAAIRRHQIVDVHDLAVERDAHEPFHAQRFGQCLAAE